MYDLIAFFKNGEQEIVSRALTLDAAMAKAAIAQPWYDKEGGMVLPVPVEA